jgi:hypothetical protein
LEFFKIHNFLDEMKMVERKLNVIKHSISSDYNSGVNSSNSYMSTKIVKRKRTHNITTEKDVLKTTITVTEDEAVSQSLTKHLKSH